MLKPSCAGSLVGIVRPLDMTMFSSSDSSLVMLAILVASAWGCVCAICEKVLLAPRRRFSWMGPAYGPAMACALFAGIFSVTGPDGVHFLFAMMMAALFFVIAALPSLGTFHLLRWGLRTRFSDESKS